MYGWLKERLSRELSRNQSGEGNSQYGKIWVYSLEEKKCILIPKEERIPDGWVLGRVIDFESKIKKKNIKIEKKLKLKEKLSIYRGYYKIFLDHGFEKFKDETNYPYSLVNFLSACKQLLPEYDIKKHHKRKGNGEGENNSQFGTKFMFNGELKIEKRIKKDDIETHMLSGWKMGQLPIYCEKCNCKLTKMRATSHKCNMWLSF